MKYSRTVTIGSSHFNEAAYDVYEILLAKCRMGEQIPEDLLTDLLYDIHGHNFRIQVTFDDQDKVTRNAHSGYIISDEVIREEIEVWSGINLSVHSDFLQKKVRATTENMAEILCRKFARCVLVSCKITVRVYEFDEAYAEYSLWTDVVAANTFPKILEDNAS